MATLIASANGVQELARIGGEQDALAVEGGVLEVEGCSAAELVRAYGSPLYVISEATLRNNFRRIRGAFAQTWPSPVAVYYALKSNNNFAIRAILFEEGAGGDCFGEGELYATFVGGADPQHVVMNGSNKTERELRKAVQLGICVNIDSEDEIGMLSEVAAAEGRSARVGLRLVVVPEEYDPLGTVASYPWGFPEEAAVPLVDRLQRDPRLDFEGYSVHIGRMSPDPTFFSRWAALLGDMIVALHRATSFVPRRIDIGGGYPRLRDIEAGHDPEGYPRDYLNPHDIAEYAEAATSPLLRAFEQASLPVPDLAIEPGRYLSGSAGTLLTTVGAVKRHSGRTWVNVDASVNNLMMRETRDYEYWILPASRMDDPYTEACSVHGPICMGKPLGTDTPLPRAARGDLLAILDAGMYAETLSTQMNGVPRPATVLVNRGTHELIKERESVNDVFARFILPERFRSYTRQRSSAEPTTGGTE
jgi:diaminopimelate decarboxylase